MACSCATTRAALRCSVAWLCHHAVLGRLLLQAATSPGAFLCHHKGGAAVLGRYFKIKILRQCSTGVAVFLDSDQLEELDLIFDAVRANTRNLLILATKETLYSMWCAGEIATAVKNRVSIVPVECDDYVAPDEETLKQLDQAWSKSFEMDLKPRVSPLPSKIKFELRTNSMK